MEIQNKKKWGGGVWVGGGGVRVDVNKELKFCEIQKEKFGGGVGSGEGGSGWGTGWM